MRSPPRGSWNRGGCASQASGSLSLDQAGHPELWATGDSRDVDHQQCAVAPSLVFGNRPFRPRSQPRPARHRPRRCPS
jgi:hypothetical protein